MHSFATLGYFCAAPGHFWEWEEDTDSQAAVWSGHGTIAMRQELTELLSVLVPEGLPPLGSILLVVAAASRNWDEAEVALCLAEAASVATGEPEMAGTIKNLWPKVSHGLEAVHRLPDELRASGPARQHLMQMIFEGAFNRLPPHMSQSILVEFQQTRSLAPFQTKGPELNGLVRLLRDLSALAKAFDRLPSGALERRLRSGLDADLAEPLELPWEEPEAVPPPADLVAALLVEGGELAQVAGLVKKLSAILHVSKPVAFQEDLPVGGVSDITNRGEPDRLLLTELAWDDLTFSARLAHHEVLYSRRESPPSEPPPQRLVLLDTGIHLWGKPRLFALGATLALQRQLHAAKGEAQAWSLIDGGFVPVGLSSVQEVRAQLGRLDPLPHPAVALERWSAQHQPAEVSGREEVFFVTHASALEKVMQTAAWQKLVAQVSLHTVQVDREGALILARHSIAGMRILSRAKLDLDELAPTQAAARRTSAVLTDEHGRLPRFYKMKPWPLRHPALPVQHCAFAVLNGGGFVGLSPAGCVCLWHKEGGPGLVLSPNAPSPNLITAAMDPNDPDRIILVFRTDGWKAAVIMIASLSGDLPPVSVTLQTSAAGIIGVRIQSDALVVHRHDGSQVISIPDGRVRHSVSRSSNPQPGESVPWFDGEKFHLSPGENSSTSGLMGFEVMLRPRKLERIDEIVSVGFAPGGLLQVQKEKGRVHGLQISQHGHVSWGLHPPSEGTGAFYELAAMNLPAWPDHGLKQAVLRDGRRVTYDPRGFLHVSEGTGEGISIVMVEGSTAIWKWSGEYYGQSEFFFGRAAEIASLQACCHHLFRPDIILLPAVASPVPATVS